MKKTIIAIIVAMMFLPTIADAQIIIKEKVKIETIKSLRMGWVTLEHSDGYYMMTIRSDNQFDDAYVLSLGLGKAQAIASLQTLVAIASTLKKNESVAFTNGGKEYTIHRGLIKGELWIKGEYYAGWGKVAKVELNSLLDALQYCNNEQ